MASPSNGDTQTLTAVYSSIIAGNLGSDVDVVNAETNTFDSAGFNLIGTGNATGAFAASGDQVIGTADPLLGPLADNGGPTWTHALLPGSPATDAGDPGATQGFDQRGEPFVRIYGGIIDIGAYERQSLGLIVDTTVDETDGNYSPGDLSLREAIGLANGNIGFSDTISFDASLNYQTITLRLGELQILDDVSIAGPGADLLTIDASGNDPTPDQNNGDGSRVFYVVDGIPGPTTDVSISGLTLTGGDLYGNGGAIFNEEDLLVQACTISNNSADSSGGIFNFRGNLTVTASRIRNNIVVANFAGGGILNLRATLP